MTKNELKNYARNCKAMEKTSDILSKKEFIERLVENRWYETHSDCGLMHGQSELIIFLYDDNYFCNGSLVCDDKYKYTKANLQELINASKVYNRLEKIDEI